jgi:hypothetical protein
MNSSANIKINSLRIIEDYFGHYTASLYEKFYAQKTDAVILDSIKSLLEEYLGEVKAKEYLKKILLPTESKIHERQR